VALYAGWYDPDVSGPFARPAVEFMPGAFAYHLHSYSAESLRTDTRYWVGPLLAKGATATMGCVAEPYLIGTPDIGIFFQRFLQSGFSFGEAAYASQRFLSWQVTVVGDPLYRPFPEGIAEKPEELENRHDRWAEWSDLRAINLKLLHGTTPADAVAALDKLEVARQSPVLMEKLADLQAEQGNQPAAIEAWRAVLKLTPSPQQRVRVMLALAGHLGATGKEAEAYAVYQEFLEKCADYPDKPTIYRRLLELARKLGKDEDAKKYERELDHAAPMRAP
jgi:tetratricopeptide (TPR) repeat protein